MGIFLDVKEWVKEIMENIQSEERGMFCTLLQQLWRARNSLVFEKKSAPIEEEVQQACMCFDEFWKAQMIEKMKCPIEKPQFSVNQKWKCPPSNIMKVNVDAAVPHDINRGVGVVIRDEMGIIMVSAIKEIPYPLEAHEAEAYAAFWGLNFAKDCYFSKVIIESDNMEVAGPQCRHETCRRTLFSKPPRVSASQRSRGPCTHRRAVKDIVNLDNSGRARYVTVRGIDKTDEA
ncbi:uncharacterized protein [Arachis hypogaea]|uniref:uncharacterized protein n=1 Tax=Arachis hypogaea TaxID=3818 RepID=UPI003B218BB5